MKSRTYMPSALLATLLTALPMTSALGQENEAQANGTWTFGVGMAAGRLSHYRGSDQNRTIALPFPYIHYQSNKLTIDREGIKSKYFSGENWDISLSGSGQLEVKSDENRARAGMPDLAWIGAIGPVFNYYLNKDKSKTLQWHVRKAYAFEDDVQSVGAVSQLTYKQHFELPHNSWGETRIVASANFYFASSDYNNYIYGVAPQYATINRASYKADGGFSGSQFQLTYQLENHQGEDGFRAAAFIRATNLSAAEFEDSPLVKKTTSVNFGVMYAWLF